MDRELAAAAARGEIAMFAAMGIVATLAKKGIMSADEARAFVRDAFALSVGNFVDADLQTWRDRSLMAFEAMLKHP